jgi:hypothetical protein
VVMAATFGLYGSVPERRSRIVVRTEEKIQAPQSMK